MLEKAKFWNKSEDLPLTRDELDALGVDEFDAELEARQKRFAEALVETETSAVVSSGKNLDDAREQYIAAKSIALGRSLPPDAAAEDIAASAYMEFQDFQSTTVQAAYEAKLDNRNRFQKAALAVGNWMNEGNKLTRWAKKGSLPGVIAGANILGSIVGGAAMTTGVPVTTAVLAGTKMAIRREAVIEAHKTRSRDIGLGEDEHKSELGYVVGTSSLTGNEAIFERSLQLLTHKGIELSKDRRSEVRKAMGKAAVVSVGAAIGGQAIGFGASHLIDKGVNVLGSFGGNIDSAGDIGEVVDLTEPVTETPAPTATIEPTAEPTIEPTAEPTQASPATSTPTAASTPEAGTVMDSTPVAEEVADEGPNDLIEPLPEEQGAGDPAETAATESAEDNESAVVIAAEEPEALIEPAAESTVEQAPMSDGTDGPEYSPEEAAEAEIGAGAAMEALTSDVTVNHGDGVTHVLMSVLESVGIENVPPEKLYEVYLGLVNDPEVGPHGIFNGATLELNEATGEYWIVGEAPFEASLTPEAAEWMIANAPELAGIEVPDVGSLDAGADLDTQTESTIEPTTESTVEQSPMSDGTDGPEYNPEDLEVPIEPIAEPVIEPAAEPVIEPVSESTAEPIDPAISNHPTDSTSESAGEFSFTSPPSFEDLRGEFALNPGDSPEQVIDGIFTKLGYNPTPYQLQGVYTEAVQTLGVDGIFVDTDLVVNNSTGQYELPAGTDSVRLTPDAIQWLQKRFDWGKFETAP